MSHSRNPKLLTPEQAELALGGLVSRTRLYQAIRSGDLPSARPARRRLIRTECLARWAGVEERDLDLGAAMKLAAPACAA